MNHAPHWRIHAQLLGMALIWGAAWTWGRIVAQAMPPLTAASLRFLISTVFLLLWLYHRDRLRALIALNRRQWAGLALAAACGVSGYAIFFMLGLRHIGAGRAAVIFSINPALTMLGAAWLFGERLNRRILGGMILAVGGSLIVAARGNPLLLLGALGTGEYLIFGCVFCWVSYSLIGRRVLTGIDALTATTATALIGGVMLLAVSLAAEGAVAWAGLAHTAPSIWLILLALSFGATLLAYLWYFEGIAALGAGSTAAYMTLIPVFAVLIAALWLHEPLTLSLVAGGTLTVCGMLLMQSGRRA